MIKFLLAILLSLSLSCGHTSTPVREVKSPIQTQHASTHRVHIVSSLNTIDELGAGAHCSSTAVGQHVLLTAMHCVANSNLIYLDKDTEPTIILAELPDGDDHVLYIVKRDFQNFVPLVQRKLKPQEPVHFWGNPGKSRDVYRDGFYAKLRYVDSFNYTFQLFTLPVYRGDSGAGIMDAEGNVVAVVSLANESAEELSLPLAFSQKQLVAAGVTYVVQ